MNKFNRSNIQLLYLGGFIIPPLFWILAGMYIGIYSISSILKMSPVFFILYIAVNIGVYIYINKLFFDIEIAYQKVGKKYVFNAQRAINYLPKFYIIILPVFGIILPLSAQTNIYGILTFEFFIEWIFGLSLIFIVSTPFFISMLDLLEKSTEDIPISGSFNDLNIESKFVLISIPNIIGTFMVTVCTYLLIFLKNDQNQDVIYILFTKSVILGVFIISIFIYNHVMLRNQILSPVKKLNEFLNNIILSGGNINVKLHLANRDEFSSIAVNFNLLVDLLLQIIYEIDSTSEDVLNSSKRLHQTTKKIGHSTQKEQNIIKEISKYSLQLKEINDRLNESSEKNHKDIVLITENIHTVNTDTREVIQNLESLTEGIRKTATNAQIGEKSLSDMRHTMEVLFNTFQEISDVMDFTNEIAEKINLLSLNASIEASRAGELGMGFAVVAQQIARLSEETKKNVRNIELLLEKSSDKMKDGTDQILKGVQTIIFLLNGVDDIEKVFGKIIFNLKEDLSNYDTLETKVGDIKSIAHSTKELTDAQSDRIKAMTEAITLTEQFITSALESVKELNTNADHGLHFANDLQKKVTQFHISKNESSAEDKIEVNT
ncbi:MAG: methyl-accepting chemotaxis protein [Spirochaetia bacterium]|nr:methyl-accepting chemotaxis protein [Spirochaetia bacterium]